MGKQLYVSAPKRVRGVTLIELMMTIAVGSIVLGIAVPSFVQVTVRNRITTYTNALVTSLNYARSEAIRRRSSMVVCSSADGASCTGADDAWAGGWIVFHNVDNDSPAVVDSGEPVLAAYGALSSSYSLASGDFPKDVAFRADGTLASPGAFAVCHDSEVVGARVITLTRTRPRQGIDSDGNGIPNTDSGDLADCGNP